MRHAAVCSLVGTLTLACSVSPSEERELGVEMAASVDSQPPLVRDTVVLGFVKALGHSMAAQTSRADLHWQFAVANTDEVTAQFTQCDESEAESEAVIITRRTYIDPEGLRSFLRKILAARTEQRTPVDVFFATHPTDEARTLPPPRDTVVESTSAR